ncbi:MAG: family 16 glycosylhydrolase [Akkermansiaceae bacterium]|nr:family 16 glycosylhydrolase [Akkermansiaceae bacterium]MDP4721587.1 family 16 glycosylhydrolase [Akkermansiaceae bacterium]MDP4897135.1 family 16 glycosylhydrolase [Akkermansiaceae bacterium]
MYTKILIVPLLLSTMVSAEPPAGTEWVPLVSMTDEFNGDSLDVSKWFDHNPSWIGREPVQFHPYAVAVGDGNLKISVFDTKKSEKLRLREGYTNVSGFVKSKTLVRFGYFEMRAKLMDSSLVSCFWLSEHTKEEWSEIDCVEIAAGVEEHSRKLRPNTHYFHGPHYKGTLEKHLVQPSHHDLGFRAADDFHVYGLEWSATHIRWYVDGKMVRELPNTRFFQPLRMNINVEANSYFKALPDDNRLQGAYEIDWVRSWRPKNLDS